jgi:TolA-binding protein
MLRFVAELCTQYASLPLTMRAEGREGEQAPVPVRAVDYAGTDLAIRLYRRLIELQPIIADNYSALMRILQLRGEVETAKKVALELTDRKTSSAEVQATAAAILEENGFAADALAFYEKSLQLSPDDLAVWMKYADALRAAGQHDRSTEILRRVLETGLHGRPFAQPQVFASLLRVANESGAVPQLLDYLDSLRARDIPGKADFYLSAAKLCVQVKADDRAETLLIEFQQKMPKDPLIPDSHLLLGQIQFGRHETQKALESFRAVIQQFPGTPAEITARFNVGEVQRQSGQLQEAVTSWVELANKRPDDDRALAGLFEAAVTVADDMKDQELAKRLFQLYIDSGPQDFALLRRARANLSALEKGLPLAQGDAQ